MAQEVLRLGLPVHDQAPALDPETQWYQHWSPTTNLQYFYHPDPPAVIDARPNWNRNSRPPPVTVSFIESMRTKYRITAGWELFVDEKGACASGNHSTTLLEQYSAEHLPKVLSEDEKKAKYWSYIWHHPCHLVLNSAKTEALQKLSLAFAQNAASGENGRGGPFSDAEIQRLIQFFEFSKGVNDSVAENIAIAYILSNWYEYRTKRGVAAPPFEPPWGSIFLYFGMPPTYGQRFYIAFKAYNDALRPDQWKLFIDRIRTERANTNTVAGLLLASSVAFLAVPGLIDIAQCFIIVATGLSLAALVVGFNAEVDKQLSYLEQLNPLEDRAFLKCQLVVSAMDLHVKIVLLSILCFYLSLMTFTAWSIYGSAFITKSYTVRYLFFILASLGLLVVFATGILWNQRFHQDEVGA